MGSNEFVEVVYLFGEEGLLAELSFRDFMRHVDQQLPLPLVAGDHQWSGSDYKAAFVVVGAELQICGLAFFLLELDEAFVPPASFNIPLAYLVRNAGVGPDFGGGRVRMACRGQCPVPWQAHNLWDPVEHPHWQIKERLSGAVRRNRLGLAPQVAGPLPPTPGTAEFADLLPPSPASRGQSARSADQDLTLLARRLEALMLGQTNELMRLQAQHEQERLDREAMHALQIDLYKKEITRLKQQLAQAKGR